MGTWVLLSTHRQLFSSAISLAHKRFCFFLCTLRARDAELCRPRTETLQSSWPQGSATPGSRPASPRWHAGGISTLCSPGVCVTAPPSALPPPILALCWQEPAASQLLGSPEEVLEPKGAGAVTRMTLSSSASLMSPSCAPARLVQSLGAHHIPVAKEPLPPKTQLPTYLS